MIGNVHSIDTFSTLDGPGIRTVVFMQGCHLRCQYCHNPDTWDCQANTAHKYESEQIFSIILRNISYFQASGGGVTFSGGEPLLQHEFVRAIFEKCRQANIHTAVDTSLYVSSDNLLELLPVTNLVLADIKHMDNEKSKLLTGAGNKLNISNLCMLNERNVDVWIRYVIVPGLTDGEDDINALGEFIAPQSNVKRVDLLPYHTLGSHKWKLLGIKYALEHTPSPTPEQMHALKVKLEKLSHKPVFTP